MQNLRRTGGMALLEHININVPDWGPTQAFYTALGCQQAVKKIHMNCGPHTQFHLPLESPTQVWRGEVTIAYTKLGLQAAHDRLSAFSQTKDGTDVVLSQDENEIVVKGGWGNTFRLREGKPAEVAMAKIATKRPQTELTMEAGVLGIVQVTLPIKPGLAESVAEFYENVFHFSVSRNKGEVEITGGPVAGSQCIVFQEKEDAPAYSGDHFCMYIGDFEGCFNRCASREILYVNQRFTHLDNSMNLEQARHWQAFRILDLKKGKESLLTEEHEIRSLDHSFLPIEACSGENPEKKAKVQDSSL
eukprot:gnl/MRDRNA2_/MRDRNA2_95108_c0_seq1.p1 gnl/MRDRNA2_/MRDRNA2_95108_c0~~gnl/MRDRNA2_/MRDRNA2_95108_c0_seq1.p1  ORF type:complete len:303 (+),score=47.70 gnl/MRDRNA2_/MRDRNA2_95108_c0_seq1:107-1015(+)